MNGKLYKMEDGVYFNAIGLGYIGVMYYRYFKYSTVITFENPQLELSKSPKIKKPTKKSAGF